MANAPHQDTLIASGSSTRRIWRAYFDLSFRILTRAHLFLFKFHQRFQVIICSVSIQNPRASLVIHGNGWLSLDARNECCCLIQDTCHGDFYRCEEINFWGNFSQFLLREDRLFVTTLRYLFVSDKISASEGGWFVFWAMHRLVFVIFLSSWLVWLRRVSFFEHSFTSMEVGLLSIRRRQTRIFLLKILAAILHAFLIQLFNDGRVCSEMELRCVILYKYTMQNFAQGRSLRRAWTRIVLTMWNESTYRLRTCSTSLEQSIIWPASARS